MDNKNKLYIEEFLDYLKFEKGLSEYTLRAYRVDINEFIHKINKKVEEIIKEDIFVYIEDMKSKFKNNTVLRKLSSIKMFFKYLYMNKYIKKDPTNSIKAVKRQKRLPEVLAEEDFNKILETFNHEPEQRRSYMILKLLLATGARISEIINLEIKDVEDNEYKYIKVLGKGSKYRFIPIYDEIAQELKKYIEVDRNLIKSRKKDFKIFSGIDRTRFYLELKKHAEQAGIQKRVYPHLVRHSIATLLLKNGADIRVVQEILGHANITTTEIYTHVEKSKLKSIYEQVGIGDDEDEN